MDTVKCSCPKCGAKYRLPIEAHGRKARCKRCHEPFEVPKLERGLDDSVLEWLMDPAGEPDEELTQPRVISMKAEQAASPEASRALKGIIRPKADTNAPK